KASSLKCRDHKKNRKKTFDRGQNKTDNQNFVKEDKIKPSIATQQQLTSSHAEEKKNTPSGKRHRRNRRVKSKPSSDVAVATANVTGEQKN
ncbi:MAG: hypothetical protein K2M16_03005, partial [Muribaculaceae bacterium]|nr:hypothetical protein [Muribaculaceae bacterium]